MDLLKLLQDLVVQLAAAQLALADAPKALEDAKKMSYDEGVASVVIPVSDKIYSQVELDAMIVSAQEPLKLQIVDLEAKLAALQPPDVAQLKADLLAKYEEMLVVVTGVETGFKDLLK